MKKSPPPSPITQRVPLPGDRELTLSFRQPDLIGIEVTPWPEFVDGEDALAFFRAYFAAREAFLQLIATLTGLRIAVVDELPRDLEAIGEAIAPAARQ